MFRNKLSIIIIILLGLFACLPLFRPGFFTMHDNQQIVRLFELDKSLSWGQFPVRWVEDLGFGYGYALFNFYPPLVYYLGEVFHLLLGTGFIDSNKIVWGLALVGSAIAMFALAKEFFGKIGGIVAALFYLYAPYHAVDAYVRGALAELFSFVWLPLILLALFKIVKERRLREIIFTGLLFGLLMLTHNLIFLPFFALAALWYFSLVLIYRRERFVAYALYFILTAILCFSLTAFFFLPALAEKQFTLVDSLLIKNLASYKIHFVCPAQLWDSPWGFGGSTSGCLDGLSFKIGKVHLLISSLSLLSAVLLWRKNRKLALTLLLSFSLLIISAFMSTNLSEKIWNNLPPLWYLQFPWRFLEFVALWASFLAGAITLLISNQKLRLILAGFIIFALLIINTKLFTPQQFLSLSDRDLLTDEEIKWKISGTSFEFMPKGIATKSTPLGTNWVDIDKEGTAKDRFQIVSGSANIQDSKIGPDRFSLVGNFSKTTLVQFSITNFPGWQIKIDNQLTPIDDRNKFKLITIAVPSGPHLVSGKFTDTAIRTLGNLISFISFLFLGLFLYLFRRKNFFG